MTISIRRFLPRLVVICSILFASGTFQPVSTAAFGSFENSAFRIRWSDRWQEVRRTDTNIVLHDGLTEIQMAGIIDDAPPQESVLDVANDWFTVVLPNAEGVAEVPGYATADETRASAVYTYQYRTSDRSLTPYAAYFEARRIAPELLLWIVVDTEWGAFSADPHFFERVLQTLEIAGTPTDGEVSQTFAAQGWRVSVPVASTAESFPALGLASQPGMRWLTIVADIVNWTEVANDFDPSIVRVVTGDGQRFSASPIHGQSVAMSLRLPGVAADGIPVSARELVRLPLVFQIPELEDTSVLAVEVGNQRIPLNEALAFSLEASLLPPEQLAPAVERATLTGFDISSQMQLQLESGEVITAPLTGIAIPELSGCHGRETWTQIMSLIGLDVLVESDVGILGEAHHWIWLDELGERVLLNQWLVEHGLATILALPESSRFALWMNETESMAKSTGAGLWQGCRQTQIPARSEVQTAEVTYVVEPGVDPSDVDFVREGIAFAEQLFAEYSGSAVGRPLTVTIHAGSSGALDDNRGLYQSDTIDLFTGSGGWKTGTDISRLYVIVHEYGHFYLDPAPHPRQRPIWLEEGLAEMLSWQLLDRAGLVENSEMLAFHALRLRVWPPGSDLCAISPQSISGIAYPLANLGSTLLVEQAPFGAVVAYRNAMTAGMSHPEAFSLSFGIDEATYCASAMTRIWSLAAAPTMPSELYGRGTELVPIRVAITKPPAVTRGSQILLEARTTESVACEWQLHTGDLAAPVTRTVRADGDGNLFWIVTIPPNALPGEVTVSVNCGSATDEVSLRVET